MAEEPSLQLLLALTHTRSLRGGETSGGGLKLGLLRRAAVFKGTGMGDGRLDATDERRDTVKKRPLRQADGDSLQTGPGLVADPCWLDWAPYGCSSNSRLSEAW